MKKLISKIKYQYQKMHIGHGIATLAIIAALTGTAASFLPPESTRSLALVSTISGAASTIISAHQSHSAIDKNINKN